MTTTHSTPTYGTYWGAWLALLVITLGMVTLGAKPLLVGGIVAKAGIITLLYMHLWHEHRRLFWTILLGIFLTSAVLVGLLVPDARAM